MRDAGPGAAGLRQLAALGPFFAVTAHDPRSPARSPWRPLRELADEPAVLTGRVAEVRGHLAAAGGQPAEAVPLRVAASVAHLGLAARLVSPALGLAVLHGPVRPPGLADLRWQPALGGAFPLSLAVDHLRAGSEVAAGADGWAAGLVGGVLQDLVRATRRLSVSPRVLWGNTASAVHGAAAALSRTAPSHAERARALAALLMDQPPLRGTGTTDPGHGRFRRRSCCLIYRASPGAVRAVCGDCVLSRG